ncbi:MAG: ice-binding family protein [Bacteroidales bacterium]|jgi:hypothetical protein
MKTKIYILLFLFAALGKVNAQAPNLGTASGFALFTAIGAFSNVDSATYVTGNVGTNAGEFTAFPTGTVIGQIYVADTVSLQAASDVITAYNCLSAIPCDSAIFTPFGYGQIFTAGVYCLAGATTLNGNIILDGQGNPDALFVFKVSGALSTTASSKVILVNSASMGNVYWQIDGAFASGDSSVFIGTIIANGAISLLESSSLFGRGLSITGAISLHNNIVTLIMPPEDQLPIELLSFNASQAGANIQLNWSTASETNNAYFTIEKSTDGIHFETVVNFNGAGNSNTLLSYSAIDDHPFPGVSYYRLKQTDFNGKFTYSNIVEVDFVQQLAVEVNIYPNPFSTSATIVINDASQMNIYELRICNSLGREVMNTIVSKQSTTLETSDLPSGTYFYKVIDNNNTIRSGKLISQQ